jgi:hypothetical protein
VPLESGGAAPRQLSLFGVEAGDPTPADLAGLLAGPGEVVRMGGTARVSIVVDAAWRVHVLAAEFAARGLATGWVPAAGGQFGVRTSYTGLLAPLGRAWLRGAVKRPPPRFQLTGHRLRLWVAAAGSAESLGFLLRLGASDELCWEPVGAALAAIGLPAVLVTPRVVARTIPTQPTAPHDEAPPQDAAPPGGAVAREARPGPTVREVTTVTADHEDLDGSAPDDLPAEADEDGDDPGQPPPAAPAVSIGPAYRITGRRRLARLAELVGERPAAAPAPAWPGE